MTFSHNLAFTRASWVKPSHDWIDVTENISINDLLIFIFFARFFHHQLIQLGKYFGL